MKKFVCLFFIFMLCFCAVGCNSGEKASIDVINVEDVVINKSHAYCDVGSKIVLLAQVFPFNANNQNVIWKSDNENVAVVNSGIVEGVKEGRTVITAQSEDGNFCDKCVLYVSSPKLDYTKYPNNLMVAVQNQESGEEVLKNPISDFDEILDDMFEIHEQMNKNINEMIDFFKLKVKNKMAENNKNIVQNLSNQTRNLSESEENDIKTSENQIENQENLGDNNVSGYFYEYKYNSHGINEEADEFTTYKDDNTIIKEMSF